MSPLDTPRAPGRFGLTALVLCAMLAGSHLKGQEPLPPLPSGVPLVPAQPPVGVPLEPNVSPDRGSTGLLDAQPVPIDPRLTGLPPTTQLVAIQAPEGVVVEPITGGAELFAQPSTRSSIYGLQVARGYLFRVTGIPNRPEAVLYPLIELVGHLHRPPHVNPLAYPIRVVLTPESLAQAVDQRRLITTVVYLEDPSQALPLSLPPDEIAVASLNPTEDPRRVAESLGRPMVVLSLGGRQPAPGEYAAPPLALRPESAAIIARRLRGQAGLTVQGCQMEDCRAGASINPDHCVRLPADEYLCDGGDGQVIAKPGLFGRITGLDPRDAIVGFNDGDVRRILPTNRVCIYSPRFAAVEVATAAFQDVQVDVVRGAERAELGVLLERRLGADKFELTQTPKANRLRVRASGVQSPVFASDLQEVRILEGFEDTRPAQGFVDIQVAELDELVSIARELAKDETALTINTPVSLVVTGIVEGAVERVRDWRPEDLTGVEEPEDRPGLAVIKQVDAKEALPGDRITFTITYRNMGNVPIRDVSISDSLLPRLAYVPGSARGPDGTVFTTRPNASGSLELRWDLPSALAPGQAGAVSFQADIR